MAFRRFNIFGTVSCLLAITMVPPLAQAAVRDSNVCPAVQNGLSMQAGKTLPDVCYSGFSCVIGLRDDWLDLTDTVTVRRPNNGRLYVGQTPRASIQSAGAEPRANNPCVPPSNKSREGYVAVELETIPGVGDLLIEAHRPGLGGVTRDSSEFRFEIRDGARFLNPSATANGPAVVTAGTERTIELRGRGLENLRVKAGVRQPFPAPAGAGSGAGQARPPGINALADRVRANSTVAARGMTDISRANLNLEPEPFEILSARYDVVRLKVNVLRPGLVSLGDYLEFAAGDPAINRDLGWPQIDVR